jgi:penicillin-binding protein 1A
MVFPIVVYSPEKIRGKIIERTLRLRGVKAQLFTTHFELKEAILKRSTPVIVIDAAVNFANEVNFIKTLAHQLPKTALIVLGAMSDESVLERKRLPVARYLPDRIDPDLILSTVRDELAARKFSFRTLVNMVRTAFNWTTQFFLRTLAISTTLVVGLTGGYIFWCVATLPEIEILEDYSPYESSKLYSYDNVLLSEFYVERRTFIPHQKIPEHVKNAIIAVEDKRFYKHHGFDFFRIIRALFTDIKERSYAQGASTITQQLAKMIFLKPEKTITRKIQEIALSLQLERRYSKDEILGLYLNQAYFGTRAYGIEAASHAYFDKSTETIDVSEAALLAALPKAPSSYSPFKNPEKAVERRNFILGKMLAHGFINEEEYKDAVSNPIPSRFHGRKYKAPYFVDYCRSILEKRYGDRLYTAGLRIYTSLDFKMQLVAEKAVLSGVQSLEERGRGPIQAALVAVDVATGRIKAMVGGTDFWKSQFNRAVQAKRQPGSAFKPIVYLTALKQGFNYNDKIMDIKIGYKVPDSDDIWIPKNYSNRYYGAVTLKEAMAKSLNCATVNLAKKVGIKNVIKTARQLGIQSKIHPWYSSALGASEVTLVELVFAYAGLAHGNRIEPAIFDRIIDKEQLLLIEPSGVQEKVISKMALANIRYMLNTVVQEGTAKKAKDLNRKVYGKTGTTNQHADALFVGFDNKLVVGVWVGKDDHTSIGGKETGASAALPIWMEFMQSIEQPGV